MTIYPKKCIKCNKINCKKFYSCVHCNNFQCLECIELTNPNMLKFRILKDNVIGVERTIYCVYHCQKVKKFCGDCGGKFFNLRSCRKCNTTYCSDCHDRNSDSISEYFVENDSTYNIYIKNLSTFYCSKNCFELDYFYDEEKQTICSECGEIFVDCYNEMECSNCRKKNIVDIDIDYNQKRKILQAKVNELIKNGNISYDTIVQLVKRKMKEEIKKNSYMIQNKISFLEWVSDVNEGANRCMVLYDN